MVIREDGVLLPVTRGAIDALAVGTLATATRQSVTRSDYRNKKR